MASLISHRVVDTNQFGLRRLGHYKTAFYRMLGDDQRHSTADPRHLDCDTCFIGFGYLHWWCYLGAVDGVG